MQGWSLALPCLLTIEVGIFSVPGKIIMSLSEALNTN